MLDHCFRPNKKDLSFIDEWCLKKKLINKANDSLLFLKLESTGLNYAT
jgi:hypothetical protein